MLGNVQAVGIFLVLVLPGFVWTKTENIFRPKHQVPTLEMLAVGLTRSLVVNAAMLLSISAVVNDKSVDWFKTLASERPLIFLASLSLYVLGGFALAFVVGYLRGSLYGTFSFQKRLQSAGLTPYSEATSVWQDTVVDEGYAPNPLPEGGIRGIWVLVTFKDGRELLGRIATYPQIVEENKPFWFSITDANDELEDSTTRTGRYSGSHAVMVNSADVRDIAVYYRDEEPNPPIATKNRLILVVGALLGWWPLWVVMFGLIAGVGVLRAAFQ